MVVPVPKWVMLRYSLLWNSFHQKEFRYADALKVLKKDAMMSIVLSELRHAEWVTLRLDERDARKRLYRLKSPEEAVKGMIK